jgi:hypothetical protein
MRLHARVWFLSMLCGVLLTGVLPAAAQAAFGVESFTATNCKVETCAGLEVPSGLPESGPYYFPKEPTAAEARTQGFTQAGGRVPFGVTDFKVNTTGAYPKAVPDGAPVSKVRVDVAAGLATSPAAVPTCSLAEFGATEALPKSGLYTAPKCKAETEIGVEKVTLYIKSLEEKAGFGDLPVEGKVYNLVQPEGLASYYGAAIKLPKFLTEGELKEIFGGTQPAIEKEQYYAHSFVKGSVEWGQEAEGTGKGDYHDYFTVEASTANPLISSRQILFGTRGEGDFITNATSCPGDNTTYVTIANEAKESNRKSFTTPIGLKGCNLATENLEGITGLEQVPFTPGFALGSGSSLSDTPNEVTPVASVPNAPTQVAQSQVKTASVTMPEGMTLDPSAAHGLEACTPAQARIHSSTFGVACPAGSALGTVALEVPTLPTGSFTGTMYLGGPESGPITGPPYTLYVVANSPRYGISVRIKGEAVPNPATGQLTAVFQENPEQPFTSISLHFNRGVLTSLANPLICGTPTGSSSFVPTAQPQPTKTVAFGVAVTGCLPTIPFNLVQSTSNQTTTAGGHTSYQVNLGRPEGNQYVSEVKTELPPGIVGEIPKVVLCGEPQASAGTCAATSQIGTATVLAGSGPTPFSFSGPVYLTTSYGGAPYGLSIAVPAVAGPFNLGTVVTRASINVNPNTAQVIADSVLPRVFKGIPLRLRSISVAVNKQGFLLNPTNCGTGLATTSTLTGFALAGAPADIGQLISTPQTALTSCSALKFKPTFKASSSSKTSRANGASLTTTITQPGGQANIKSVKVQLPKQLPSRLTTLHKACLAAVFAVSPFKCPSGSFVGTASVSTPTLPGKLQGVAILVSHSGAAFPDLDLFVESAAHLRVILTGNTDIKKGITTTTFASTPDVPVTSVTVNLPTGPHSALGAYGDLCAQPLVMPTTIVSQSGKTIKQNTIISVAGCGVRIVGHKVVGNTAYITVRTFAAGRISGSGSGLKTVYRSVSRASTVSLKVPLSASGRGRHRPLSIKLRVGFVPRYGGAHSASTTKVTFR